MVQKIDLKEKEFKYRLQRLDDVLDEFQVCLYFDLTYNWEEMFEIAFHCLLKVKKSI